MPIFHCDAKPLALGPRVGLDPQCDDFALSVPTCWYLKTLKFALPPTLNANASQWNIGCVGSLTQSFCVAHFMLFILGFFCVGYPTQTLFPVDLKKWLIKMIFSEAMAQIL